MEVANIANFSKEQCRRIIRYSTNYHLTGNNAVHVTLNFAKGSTREQQDQAWRKFMDKLIEVTRLSRSKVAAFGWTFNLSKKGYEWPHAHCVVYSSKDRVTGRTIAKLAGVEHDELSAYWKAETGGTLKIRRIYDAPGLMEYIAGPCNLDVSDQQIPDDLYCLNRQLLKTKMKQAA